jgi:hypothetical protein
MLANEGSISASMDDFESRKSRHSFSPKPIEVAGNFHYLGPYLIEFHRIALEGHSGSNAITSNPEPGWSNRGEHGPAPESSSLEPLPS